jgi:hypothetical protein
MLNKSNRGKKSIASFGVCFKITTGSYTMEFMELSLQPKYRNSLGKLVIPRLDRGIHTLLILGNTMTSEIYMVRPTRGFRIKCGMTPLTGMLHSKY